MLFESKKLYDNQVPDWIAKYLNEKGYKIENKGYEFINYLMKVNKIEFSIDNLVLIINNHENYFEHLLKNNSSLFDVITEKLIEEKVREDKKEKIKIKFKMLRF